MPAQKTYPQLGLQTTLDPDDLLASWRDSGPLKTFPASVLTTYLARNDLSNVDPAVGRAALGIYLPQIYVEDYGSTGSDYLADTTAWQAAIDYAASINGGHVIGTRRTYKIGSLTNSASNIVIDGNLAEVETNVTAHPMILNLGAAGTPRAVTTATKGTNTVVMSAGLGADFAAGQTVRLADETTFHPPWDYGSANPDIGPGYDVTVEMHTVKEVVGDTITLNEIIEHDFLAGVTLTVLTMPRNIQVCNFHIQQADPGSPYVGTIDDLPDAPHLIASKWCQDVSHLNNFANGWVLHLSTFRECIRPVSSANIGIDPYFPDQGGQGYISRADRSLNPTFTDQIGVNARHIVDDVQCVGTYSFRNIGQNSVATDFDTHGHGAVRFVSDSDRSIGVSGNIGWAIGNPDFSADYDCEIRNPMGSGGTNRIFVGTLSENTKISGGVLGPSYSSSGSRDIFICSGAKNTTICNVQMKSGPETISNIFSRSKVNNADAFGIAPDGIRCINNEIDTSNGPTTQVAIELDCVGDAIAEGNVGIRNANIVNFIRVGLNNIPSRVRINNNISQGTGTCSGTWIRTVNAPTGQYYVCGNSDASGTLRLIPSGSLICTHNSLSTTITWDADVYAATAAGAVIRDNIPPNNPSTDRKAASVIDTLYTFTPVVVSDGTNPGTVTYGIVTGSPDQPSAYRPYFNDRINQSSGNREFTTRNSDGTLKAFVGQLAWSTGLWTFSGVPNYVGVPASSTATGVAGSQSYDANYLYQCYATDSWNRFVPDVTPW